jgi:hypothetical protein
MRVRTQPLMVNRRIPNAVRYENSNASFASLRIVKGVDCPIYMSNTNMEEGH